MAVEAAPTDVKPEEQWPAVALAYEFVRPSYDLMLRRFDVVEGRLRALLTLMATLTLGTPLFVRTVNAGASYASPFFIAAISAAAFILLLGAFASTFGWLGMPDPGKLHDSALQLSSFDFQRVVLRNASLDFDKNRARLERKARAADWMAGALIVEIALMTSWAISLT